MEKPLLLGSPTGSYLFIYLCFSSGRNHPILMK